MGFQRDTKELKKENEAYIDMLINEALSGVTKMDTLKNEGRILSCREAQIMYYTAIRHFFQNSISKRVMNHNQDIFEFSEKGKKF